MTQMTKIMTVTLVLGALTACGSDGGSAANNAKPVAKGVAALISNNSSGTSAVRQGLRQVVAEGRARVSQARFAAAARRVDNQCSGAPTSEDGATCSATCSDTALDFNCELTTTRTETCGADQFTVGPGTYSMQIDSSQMSTANLLLISADFSMNLAGGGLSGGKLECAMRIALDFGATDPSDTYEPSCDAFTCSYAGSPISCEQMKEAYGDVNCDSGS